MVCTYIRKYILYVCTTYLNVLLTQAGLSSQVDTPLCQVPVSDRKDIFLTFESLKVLITYLLNDLTHQTFALFESVNSTGFISTQKNYFPNLCSWSVKFLATYNVYTVYHTYIHGRPVCSIPILLNFSCQEERVNRTGREGRKINVHGNCNSRVLSLPSFQIIPPPPLPFDPTQMKSTLPSLLLLIILYTCLCLCLYPSYKTRATEFSRYKNKEYISHVIIAC